MPTNIKKATYLAVFLAVVLLTVELKSFLLESHGQYVLFSKKPKPEAESFISKAPLKKDLTVGFRWENKPIQALRRYQKEVIFDNTFHGNNRGYISSRNYSFKKEIPKTFRVMVLGDSFSAPIYISQNWIDWTHDYLQKNKNKEMEFFSFSMDGAGIEKWHQILISEILPNYEFDAVVLSSGFFGTLSSPFLYMDSQGDGVYESTSASFSSSKKIYSYWEEGQKELLKPKLLGFGLPDWDWKATQYLLRTGPRFVVDAVKDIVKHEVLPLRNAHSKTGSVSAALPSHTLQQFEEIVLTLKKQKKSVFLAAIPERNVWEAYAKEGVKADLQKVFAQLSEKYSLDYFDGFSLFNRKDPDNEMRRYWLKYDSHWNQAGSNVFAQAFSEWILTR